MICIRKEDNAAMLEKLKFAIENGSFRSLLIQLEYLDSYGCKDDRDRDTAEVDLFPSWKAGEGYFDFVIYFMKYDREKGTKYRDRWMNGGLVHFTSSNDWSVHT